MKYIIIAFKSKNSLYSLQNYLKKINVKSEIINTPRSLSSSCGLSLKIVLHYYRTILNVLKTTQNLNIIGCYLIEYLGFQEKIERIF